MVPALPDQFTHNIILAFGDAGRRYLADLPRLLDEAARRWKLLVGEPFLLSYNYVCAATLADGTPAVLKIGVPNRELTSEIAALRLYAGEGACQISSQNKDGSWGTYLSTAEETAYVLQALWVWNDKVARITKSVFKNGERWLRENMDLPYPPLWIGKCLYNPSLVIRSAVISALTLLG